MKNVLTLTAVFCLLFAATLGCQNNRTTELKEPELNCAIDLPKLDSAAEYVERGNKQLTKKNYECGVDDCQKALNLDPENVEALLCRGYAYKNLRKYELAESDFTEAIRLAPDSQFTFSQRAQLYYEIEKLDQALRDMNRVIELSPAYFHFERRAAIYAELKDYENAVKDCTEAIRQRPETDYYYENRAKLYRLMGKTDLAEADEIKYEELKKSGNGIKKQSGG